MRSRLIVAGICVPAVFIVIFLLPPFATGILLAAICGLSAWELTSAVKAVSNLRIHLYPVIAAVLLPLAVGFGFGDIASVAVPFLLLAVIFADAVIMYEKGTVMSLRNIAVIMFAGAVMPQLLTNIVWLRIDELNGRIFVLMPFIIAFIADGGAYFAGMKLGRHHIFPETSPKKTLEGCVGGIVAAVLAMLIYGGILKLCHVPVSFLPLIVYAVVGAVATELGDLAFSLIKRQHGVKDYGTILREHGGMLDRFDSMVFAAPVITALIAVFPAF